MSVAYEDLDRAAQIAAMRRHARNVLAEYPIDVRSLRLVLHGFNTTFRVGTTTGEQFALRINVNSHRSPEQIAAEQEWLAALASDTGLRVPVPHPNRRGDLVTAVASTELRRALPSVLTRWLPGRDLGDRATVRQVRQVGAALAMLHQHASGFRTALDSCLVRSDTVMLDLPDNISARPDLFDEDALEVLRRTEATVNRHLQSLYSEQVPILIHQDLHNSNVRSYGDGIAVIDFDDCGLGLPVQDLAVSTYYLRDNRRKEAALFEGYATVRTLPGYAPEQFEALVAGRNLLLLNDVLTITTADLREMIPRYAHNSVVKLRNWLDTGVYRHDVSGLAE